MSRRHCHQRPVYRNPLCVRLEQETNRANGLQNEVNQLRVQLNEKNQQIAQLQSQLATAPNPTEIEKLRRIIIEKNTKLRSLTKQLDEANENIEKITQELAIANEDLVSANSKNQELDDQLKVSQDHANELESKLIESEHSNQSLGADLMKAQENGNQLESKLIDFEHANQSLNQDLAAAKQTIIKINTSYDSEIKGLKNKLAEEQRSYQTDKNKLNQEIQSLTQQKAAQQRELEQKQAYYSQQLAIIQLKRNQPLKYFVPLNSCVKPSSALIFSPPFYSALSTWVFLIPTLTGINLFSANSILTLLTRSIGAANSAALSTGIASYSSQRFFIKHVKKSSRKHTQAGMVAILSGLLFLFTDKFLLKSNQSVTSAIPSLLFYGCVTGITYVSELLNVKDDQAKSHYRPF
jgi:septal ring factor EnvC (AmiA/AmiB activator)